jgi:hypothetical protein
MFGTENLPNEMKEAMFKVQTAIRRLRKAEKQTTLWDRELLNAREEYNVIEKSYALVCQRWNPDTNTMEPMEEKV